MRQGTCQWSRQKVLRRLGGGGRHRSDIIALPLSLLGAGLPWRGLELGRHGGVVVLVGGSVVVGGVGVVCGGVSVVLGIGAAFLFV